jgi:hypothetical protein
MTQQAASAATPPANGHSTAHELFALTDEQILEIELEVDACNAGATGEASVGASFSSASDAAAYAPADQPPGGGLKSSPTHAIAEDPTPPNGAEPPKWLAEMMVDPQAGGEARDFWNGIQQARQEAAAYREVFARPDDARAAAERARTLEEVDAAFYGGEGKSPEQASAARMQLAQHMMREDPAAFREMVFAGLRALEAANNHGEQDVGARFSAASSGQENAAHKDGGVKSTPTQAGETPTQEQGAQLSAYRAFEKTANEELERSVGGAIERALTQALPNANGSDPSTPVGARHAVPLQERLSAAIREDIEAALKGDRQLGEQVSQILASRRFDDATRAQVVRLINDRAQQLVPVAARRVINEWTQTTFSAHRAKAQKVSSAGERADLAPQHQRSLATAGSNAAAPRSRANEASRPSIRPGRFDYSKLSDEQILDM